MHRVIQEKPVEYSRCQYFSQLLHIFQSCLYHIGRPYFPFSVCVELNKNWFGRWDRTRFINRYRTKEFPSSLPHTEYVLNFESALAGDTGRSRQQNNRSRNKALEGGRHCNMSDGYVTFRHYFALIMDYEVECQNRKSRVNFR